MQKFATALYGRTSKDDPRRLTISIQRTMLRDWAMRDPLVGTIVEEYWDEGVSGKLPLGDRPEGKRLLAAVQAGKVQSVAVAYADRLGRTLLDGLQAVQSLEDAGVLLVAVNDGWDARRGDSPLYLQFRLLMAEEEHRRIGQRMKDGQQRAMDRDDAPPGGPLVFGYRMGAQGQFVPDPIEAPIVVRLFGLAAQGHPLAPLLEWVKRTGVPAGLKFQKRAAGAQPFVVSSHRSATWHLSKVSKILRNRTYLGERTWGKRTFPCTPLVDGQTWDQVQVLCEQKNRQVGRRGGPSKGLLSGLLVCECGAKFYHWPRRARRASGAIVCCPAYMCNNRRRGTGCKAKTLRLDCLDEQVWQRVEAYLADPEAVIRKVIVANEKFATQIAALDTAEREALAEMDAIETEVRMIWTEQAARDWPLSWAVPKLDSLRPKRDAAVVRLEEARLRRAAVCIDRDQTAAVIASLASLRARLACDRAPDTQYQVVRSLVVGGSVKTTGAGRNKTAEVSIRLKWGEVCKVL